MNEKGQDKEYISDRSVAIAKLGGYYYPCLPFEEVNKSCGTNPFCFSNGGDEMVICKTCILPFHRSCCGEREEREECGCKEVRPYVER